MATNIVFIDSRVSDYQSLIDSLTEPSEVFILDGESDGLTQMASYLQGRTGIDALHIISHGSQGTLYLGSTVLDSGNLLAYQQSLQAIGASLSDTGDILLYGCDVARGEVGVQFITSLADLTGADVAASTNMTGSSTFGGDWELEGNSGSIEEMPITDPNGSFTRLLGTGIIWDEWLIVDEKLQLFIPAYGDYGGPGWTGGVRGGEILSYPTGDVLDQIFWQHDIDYSLVNPEKNPIEVLTANQKKELSTADTKAIAAMMDLMYVDGTDMQAYAGATIIAFITVMEDRYQVDYPYGVDAPSKLKAITTGYYLLSIGLNNIEISDADDFSRKWGIFELTTYSAAQYLSNSQDGADVAKTAAEILAKGLIAAALSRTISIADATHDLLKPVVGFGYEASKFVIVGAIKALFAFGTGIQDLVVDIASLGGSLIRAGVITSYHFLLAATDAVLDAGLSAYEKLSFFAGLGSKLMGTGLINATEYDQAVGQDIADAGATQSFGTDVGEDVRLGAGIQVYFGFGGNDTIYGGDGGDFIYAGTGDDQIFGELDSDVIYAGSGRDTIYGGAGNDSLFGESDDDLLHGEGDNDTLYGGTGSDTLYGDEGHDLLKGEVGADTLYGGAGNDEIYGDEDSDRLFGESGSDTLFGGTGADTLNGGDGADSLTGQSSSDTFVFTAEAVTDTRINIFDTITDYDQGNSTTHLYFAGEGDLIDLTAVLDHLYPALLSSSLPAKVKAEANADGQSASLYVQDTNGSWLRLIQLDGIRAGNTLDLVLASGTTERITVGGIPGTPATTDWDIVISPTTVTEGNTAIGFTITRSSAVAAQTVYLSTTVNHGSLNQGDYDYWLNVPVTFAIGVLDYTTTIQINEDTEAEGSETFGFIVQDDPAKPASSFLGSATFTIEDDDAYVDPGTGATWTGTSDSESHDGTDGHDNLTGNGGNDDLFGLGGNDQLSGGSGDDSLSGGDGNDSLYGYDGNDTLRGGAGNDSIHVQGTGADVISGGTGIDTLGLDRSDLTTSVTVSVVSDGNGSTYEFGLSDGTTVTNVELLSLVTGGGDDHVTFATTRGMQSWAAGTGTDTAVVDFSAFASAVEAWYSGYVRTQYNGSDYDYQVSLSGVENHEVRGGSGNDSLNYYYSSGNSVLYGNDGDDALDGGAGNDSLIGGAGNDTLSGRSGNDTLRGGSGNDWMHVQGAGADVIDGGTGIDTLGLDRSDLTTSVTVAVVSGGNGSTYEFSLSDGPTVTNVELLNLTTGSGDDHVTFANTTTPGNQYWSAGAGTDTAVVDFSAFASAVETRGYIGRNSHYYVSTQYNGDGYRVDLPGVENYEVRGGSGNDSLSFSSSSGNSVLFGNDGNDTLSGGSGNNSLSGGAGDDILSGGAGNDSISGGAGNDRLGDGYNGNDTLLGGQGNDWIVVQGTGVDVIEGGSGVDTLYLSRSGLTANVTVEVASDGNGSTYYFSLPDGTTTSGIEALAFLATGAGDDKVTFTNFEILAPVGFSGEEYQQRWSAGTGVDTAYINLSSYASTLTTKANYGNVYGDTTYEVSGTLGFINLTNVENLVLYGGLGNDQLYTIKGNSTLIGGDGDDAFVEPQPLYGNDLFVGGAGNDSFQLSNGFDTVIGGEGNDMIQVVGTGADVIDGGSGVDTLALNRSYLTTPVTVAFVSDGNGGVYEFSLPDGTMVKGIELLSLSTGSGDDHVTFANTTTPGRQFWGAGAGTDTAVVDFSAFVSAVDAQYSTNYDSVRTQYNGSDYQVSLSGVENHEVRGGSGHDYLYFYYSSGNNVLFGNDGNDTLTGGSGNDSLSGGAGNDSLNGGDGNDVASYSGSRANYTLTALVNGYIVTDNVGSDGADTLTNIETLIFADATENLDATAPTVATFFPADEATDVAIVSDIVVTFSEPIARGTGNITLKTTVGQTIATYDAATSTNLSLSGNTLTINPADDLVFGTSYTVEISSGAIKDAAGNSYSGTTDYNFSTAAFVNTPHSGAVTILGAATQGQTLTAANTLADADGLGAINLQWNADGTAIAGATGNTLVLSQAQVGKTITLTASYTDNRGTAESQTSEATPAVLNVDDPASGTLAIAGVAREGATISADTRGLSDVDGGITSLAYQWQINSGSNWSDISGATSASLSIPGDLSYLDSQVRLNAVSTDAYGGQTSFTSAAKTVTIAGQGTTIDLLAYSWKSHTLLDGVVVDAAAYYGQTDSGGAVSFADVIETSLSFAISRPIPAAEAAATASAVNLQDAIAILKMIVGLDVNGAGKALSPYQALAADFDGSGAVGLTDAIGVLKHVVGLSAPEPTWHFANEADMAVPGITPAGSVALPAINVILDAASPVHVGLVGYLRGDVDGSFAGAAGATSLDASYFTSLVENTQGLELSQFGVYA